MPMCSIVVPAYNVAAYLGETLESVQKQHCSDWELIVVDDGSTDDTAAVVGNCSDARLRLIRQSNHGVSHARNRGLAEAQADFVLFLDGDDRLSPHALDRLLKALSDSPEAVAAYGEAVIMDAAGGLRGAGQAPVFNARPSGEVLVPLVTQNFIVTPGVLCLRRSALQAAGGFREDLRVAEDWELWCRVALRGHFIYIGGEPVLEYRLRPGSVVRSTGLVPDEVLNCVF